MITYVTQIAMTAGMFELPTTCMQENYLTIRPKGSLGLPIVVNVS